MTMVQGREEVQMIKLSDYGKGVSLINIDDKVNKNVIDYVLPRLEMDRSSRSTRAQRFASIDRMKSTWQKLSKDDSIRQQREEATGIQQGIAATLPIVDTHIEDTVAFFSEIYFPSTSIFYANQDKPTKVEQITKLAKVLEQDTKVDGFYATGASAIRSLLKYNMGGIRLTWAPGDEKAIGSSRISGNRNQHIDVYNYLWDTAIQDVNKIRTEAEWSAQIMHKNRYWVIKGAQEGRFSRVKELLDERKVDGYNQFESKFYKHPPSEVGLTYDGLDEQTGQNEMTEAAWASYGLSLGEGQVTALSGHEIIEVFIWLSPKQLELGNDEELTLYKIIIADSCEVLMIEEMKDAVEIPDYFSYFRMDEMGQAARSYAESMRAFQRHISFMANTAMAVERGNTYNMRVYDPGAIDDGQIQSGQTSGWLRSKAPGRDVRSIVANLNLEQDTARHYNAIAAMIGLMKEMYPSQGIPAQVAGIDRAVNSQVAAVMVGAVRRLHMWVKSLDATLFGPWRVACYRNYIDNSAESGEFSTLTEEDVATLLSSGLAQLNREVGAAAIERILFTLIQNPDSAAQFDLPGLFRAWSMLLGNGIDLSAFVSPQGAAGSQGAQVPVEANAVQPVAQPGAGGEMTQ